MPFALAEAPSDKSAELNPGLDVAEAFGVDSRGLAAVAGLALTATVLAGCSARQSAARTAGLSALGPVTPTPSAFSVSQRSLLSKLVTADDLTGWRLLVTPHAMVGSDCDNGLVDGVGSNLATTDSRHMVLTESAQQFQDDRQAAKAAEASATFNYCGPTPTEGPLTTPPHMSPYKVIGAPSDVSVFLSESSGHPPRVVLVVHRGRVMIRAMLGWDESHSSTPPDAVIKEIAAALHHSANNE